MFPLWKTLKRFAVGVCFVLCVTQAADPEIRNHPKTTTWSVSNKNPQELQCAARGSRVLRIEWLKDGKPIVRNKTAGERIWLSDPVMQNWNFYSSLHFERVLKTDEGSYQCFATNQRGSAMSAAAKLTVYGPPSVNQNNPLPNRIHVSCHEPFFLQCEGKGPPRLRKVMWDYTAYSADKTLFHGTQNKRLSDTVLRKLPREDNAMLQGAVRYKVFCIAFNDEGSQRSSTTMIFIKQVPGTPVITKITPLDFGRVASLYWKPGSNGYDKLVCFAEISGKEQKSQLPMDSAADEYKKFIANLQPLTSYTVRIQCRNSIGNSDWTARMSFTTKEGYPDQAPRNITVTAINSTTLNVSWSPIPSDHIFGNLLGYRIKLTRGGDVVKTKTTGANEIDIQLSELRPGTNYCVTVLGFTKAKDGDISKPVCQVLPYASISSPIIKQIKTAQRAVTFEYVDGNNLSGTLINCSIVILDGEHHEIRVRVTVSDEIGTKIVRNLLSNTRYEATIECSSKRGGRVYSKKKIFRTPEEKPQIAPKNLGSEAREGNLIVHWDDMDMNMLNSYGNFTGYNVCVVPAAGNENSRCILTYDACCHTFPDLEHGTYTVTVAACTNAGCGRQAFTVVNIQRYHSSTSITPLQTTKNTTTPTYTGAVVVEGHFNFVYAAIGVLAVMIFIVSLALYLRKRKRHKENQQRNGATVVYAAASNNSEQYSGMSPSSSNTNTLNPYEVPLLSHRPLLSAETLAKLEGVKFSRDRLLVGERLGKGEFGRVYKGKFRPPDPTGQEDEEGNLEVAVKTMIMDEYDASEREEFVKEGLRMKGMDHPHVMRLIGICLPEEGGGHSLSRVLSGFEAISPLVVVPYMENGDLRNYLYNARVENNSKHITLNKLLHFARDIANGMEYLSLKNIVHRDLACRNCMLDSRMNVVVSDFGLSRQIYSSNYYRQKKTAKMPVKWMALESLLDRIYNSMTDVWSFGVTAWEIFTFCQNPYPGVQNHEMHELLKAGTRLKQPKGCPNDIWNDAIYPCWDPRSEERPTFEELGEMFSGYLKAYTEDFESDLSSNPVYVNVLPPDGYETLATQDEPLLRSNTISSENNDLPMPYHSAIEKKDSNGKQGREKSSSIKKLLKKEKDDRPKASGTENRPRHGRDRNARKRKDTLEEFVVEL